MAAGKMNNVLPTRALSPPTLSPYINMYIVCDREREGRKERKMCVSLFYGTG